MKSISRWPSKRMSLDVLVGIVVWFSISPTHAQGQAGYNAVYNSNGNCSSTSPCTASSAFVDVSAVTQHADICDTIYLSILSSSLYPQNGEVIDARGISGAALTCTKGSPWNESGVYVNKPATILLPAGTIIAPVPWVLPANTKLIGVAKGTGVDYILETTIKANFSSGAVVQFGDSAHCPSSGCQGISVEHLTISANLMTNAINGIENDNCGLLCYADHITMYQVLGTGLKVSGTNATDSGPYSDITFDVGGTPDASTQCAQIIGTNGTRGIHGMTCIASPDATNGILLDASNNSIEDVRIVGFQNGIVVAGPPLGFWQRRELMPPRVATLVLGLRRRLSARNNPGQIIRGWTGRSPRLVAGVTGSSRKAVVSFRFSVLGLFSDESWGTLA